MDVPLPKTGDLISVISGSEIRYEGRLFMVDTEAQTIILQNVRVMGTEGRSIHLNVPPQPDFIEMVVYTAQNIKEIQILRSSDTGQPNNHLTKSQALSVATAEQELCKMFAGMVTSAPE